MHTRDTGAESVTDMRGGATGGTLRDTQGYWG